MTLINIELKNIAFVNCKYCANVQFVTIFKIKSVYL